LAQSNNHFSLGNHIMEHHDQAWFALALATQLPLLEATTRRAKPPSHACHIALQFHELSDVQVVQLFL
jgi:hypothetical protein